MRHAIVGAGFGADAHLPAFSAVPGVQVVGLADSGSGRAKQRARGAVACFSHWAQMLDEARPDTLSIAVPPLAQTEIALAALARGIHVLCEKPVGRGVSEAQQICEAARRASLVAAVTFQFRFEPGLQSLQREFRDGRIGGLRRLDFSWITAGRADSTRPWSWQHDASQGGGVLTAFMPHVADLIAWLTHDRVAQVVARTAIVVAQRPAAQAYREVTAEDSIDAMLQLEQGAMASVRVTNCQRGGEGMRIEMHGEKGVLVLVHRPPFVAPAIVEFSDGQRETIAVAGSVAQGLDSRAEPLHRLAQAFVAAVNKDAASDLPLGDDALNAHLVVAAMRESERAGRFCNV